MRYIVAQCHEYLTLVEQKRSTNYALNSNNEIVADKTAFAEQKQILISHPDSEFPISFLHLGEDAYTVLINEVYASKGYNRVGERPLPLSKSWRTLYRNRGCLKRADNKKTEIISS